jgi:hypothetical protein
MRQPWAASLEISANHIEKLLGRIRIQRSRMRLRIDKMGRTCSSITSAALFLIAFVRTGIISQLHALLSQARRWRNFISLQNGAAPRGGFDGSQRSQQLENIEFLIKPGDHRCSVSRSPVCSSSICEL